MAYIYQVTEKSGRKFWKVTINKKGYRMVSLDEFRYKPEAKAWAKRIEEMIDIADNEEMISILEQKILIKALRKNLRKKVDTKI